MYNVFFLFLFNVANKSWLCTNYNHLLEDAQTDCLFFYSIDFELSIFICIMTCFIIIKASDVAPVFAVFISFDDFDINSWNMRIWIPHLVLPILLFFFFLKFCRKFWVIRALKSCWYFWIPSFRFLHSEVFYWLVLSAGFSRGSMQ